MSTLTKANVKSPMAQCLLVRYVAQVVADSQPGPNGEARPFYDFLESCLRHKTEMVIFEAARAVCNLKVCASGASPPSLKAAYACAGLGFSARHCVLCPPLVFTNLAHCPACPQEVTARELAPAVAVLQLFLSSSKPVLRFAAVRTLNRVAMTHPIIASTCNIDMESLISDQNRSIATLAITTLLKTGSEQNVDKLLKQIGTFMSDIAGGMGHRERLHHVWHTRAPVAWSWQRAWCCQCAQHRLCEQQPAALGHASMATLLVHMLLLLLLPHAPTRTDDFKIVVVEAIRSLCLKFPLKYRALMNFLSNVLREEGGFEYKKAIVHTILQLIQARACAPLGKHCVLSVCLLRPSHTHTPAHGLPLPPCIVLLCHRTSPMQRRAACRTCASSSRTASSRTCQRRSCTCWVRGAVRGQVHSGVQGL